MYIYFIYLFIYLPIYLPIYLFILVLTLLSTHCIGHITKGSFMGRGNQYIQLVRVLYCKLATNGKQLSVFPLEVRPGTELRSQRWEVRVLPLCHRGPDYVYNTKFIGCNHLEID